MSSQQERSTKPALLTQIFLAILSAGFLSIPFLDHTKFYFAWFAFVPLLAAIEFASLKRTYLLGLVSGFTTFYLGTFWMQDYLIVAKEHSEAKSLLLASIGWFFSAQAIAMSVLVYQYLRQKSEWATHIIFPIVVATIMASMPMLFSIRLAESQVNFVYALQALEIFGMAGLDLIIALSNILIYTFLRNKLSKANVSSFSHRSELITQVVSCLLILGWIGYGVLSYQSWENKIDNWESLTIGLVQPNEDPTKNVRLRYPAYSQSYPPELDMSQRLSQQGAELLIWPEGQAKNYLNNARIKTAFAESIRRMQTPLLFQDTQNINHADQLRRHNVAVMLDENGYEIGQYQKIKRIPIGEYIPFEMHSEFIRKNANMLFGSSSNQLVAGEDTKVFSLSRVNIVPIICYETTFPEFVAAAISQQAMMSDENSGLVEKNKSRILIALSNDGWFNSFYQSQQHIFASSLRAVENRVPLVHAVNNGPSIVVLPSGKRHFTTDYRQAGGYIIDVPFSDSEYGSFYSRYPKLFLYLLYFCFAYLLLFSIGSAKLKPNEA